MKLLIALTLCIGSGATALISADSPDKNAAGSDMRIVWQSTTNGLPDTLWVYKVIPQTFPQAVISNLMALTGFTEKDKAKVPTFIKDSDNKATFYGELEGTVKHLTICPILGFIDYTNPKAEASTELQKIEGVPNEQETTRLGIKYLRLLGIDTSQIARVPGTVDLDLHWQKGTITYTDSTLNKEAVRTNSCGVMFSRCIDGVKIHGYGGMDVSFGNNARVRNLQLSWRNLEPYRLVSFPALQQIETTIKNGKIQLHPLGTKAVISFQGIRTLTITQMVPIYEGKTPDKPMDYMRPYITFRGLVNNGSDTITVWFEYRISD